MDQAGADGLVLFNRFLQPDIDPETLTVTARHGLSTQAEGRLPRAWIALLAGRVRASLARPPASRTPPTWLGTCWPSADVVMTASALLGHGPDYAAVLVEGCQAGWRGKGFRTVGEVRGMLSVPAWADEADYERAGYITALRQPTATTALGNRGQPADRQRRRGARACRTSATRSTRHLPEEPRRARRGNPAGTGRARPSARTMSGIST
jgi:dihydroorotate dehydrogenase (fumarate)